MTTQGIERIPDSLGYLVINEDGAVLSVSDTLNNLCSAEVLNNVA